MSLVSIRRAAQAVLLSLTLGAAALMPFRLDAQSTAASRPARAAAPDQRVWPDEGPRKWAPRPTETRITANDLRTRLYQIADDSMRGRRIGRAGEHQDHGVHRARVRAARPQAGRR
jgi:hypothetical protein